MITLEQKHLALLEDAECRGHADTQNIRVCFEVLTLAAAIDQACAARLAPLTAYPKASSCCCFCCATCHTRAGPHELADKAGSPPE